MFRISIIGYRKLYEHIVLLLTRIIKEQTKKAAIDFDEALFYEDTDRCEGLKKRLGRNRFIYVSNYNIPEKIWVLIFEALSLQIDQAIFIVCDEARIEREIADPELGSFAKEKPAPQV